MKTQFLWKLILKKHLYKRSSPWELGNLVVALELLTFRQRITVDPRLKKEEISR
jgi:hypothetical protein